MSSCQNALEIEDSDDNSSNGKFHAHQPEHELVHLMLKRSEALIHLLGSLVHLLYYLLNQFSLVFESFFYRYHAFAQLNFIGS